MEGKPLPENVASRKPKKPKGWSYPMKTSELVEGLDLGTLGDRVSIFFNNSPPRPCKAIRRATKDTSFGVLSISQGGIDEIFPFFISVGLCRPQYRQRLLKALQEDVFPLIRKWLRSLPNGPARTSLTLYYKDRSHYQGGKKSLMLTENGTRELLVKELDLDKEQSGQEGRE